MDPELLLMILQALGGGTGGGNLGYGVPELLPQLLGSAAPSTDEARGMNVFQDLMQSATDPLTRIMLGTYEPQPAPEQPEFNPIQPLADTYLQGEGVWRAVAEGLLTDRLDPEQAVQLIKLDPTFGDNDNSPYRTAEGLWDSELVRQKVSDILAEKRSNQERLDSQMQDYSKMLAEHEAKDPFRQLGLPSPFERYSPEAGNVTLTESGQGYANAARQGAERDAKRSGPEGRKGQGGKGRSALPSFGGGGGKTSGYRDVALRAMEQGRSDFLNDQGRTPLKDNLEATLRSLLVMRSGRRA